MGSSPQTPSSAGTLDSPISLAELAQAAVAGDGQATGALLASVRPRIEAVARGVLGRGDADVDDVVQQSILAFVQALPGFRGECAPPRFASRIAVRTALAVRKRSRSRQLRWDDEVDVDGLPSACQKPSALAFAARRKELLRELLCELPEAQAEALALRIVLGWTLKEVSEATGAPVNTVRSRVRLAKEALRRRILADPVLLDELEQGP